MKFQTLHTTSGVPVGFTVEPENHQERRLVEKLVDQRPRYTEGTHPDSEFGFLDLRLSLTTDLWNL
jgi:hypothetical protein